VATDTIRGQHSRAVAAFLCLLPVVAAAAQNPTCVMAKNILVTGGNAGIGLALCKVSPVECGLKPNLDHKAESRKPKP
jgi:FlaA1/EpsC-like NDP-sugar epimerase